MTRAKSANHWNVFIKRGTPLSFHEPTKLQNERIFMWKNGLLMLEWNGLHLTEFIAKSHDCILKEYHLSSCAHRRSLYTLSHTQREPHNHNNNDSIRSLVAVIFISEHAYSTHFFWWETKKNNTWAPENACILTCYQLSTWWILTRMLLHEWNALPVMELKLFSTFFFLWSGQSKNKNTKNK